ncbi:hypothetical protein P171DRAFT_338706, partial [Karstenula rhodostoma CBS 690.94]
MATFHPLPRLPYELCACIWELTVEPRTVEVRVDSEALTSATPVPAVLQVCREARSFGLYHKTFSELGHKYEGLYVWLNPDIDMIDIRESLLYFFKPVALTIRRLRMEREWSASYKGEHFYHWEQREIEDFENLEEIYIVCMDGLEPWDDVFEGRYWPCGKENVFLIDPENSER